MLKRHRDRLITAGGLIAGALLTGWITLTGFELTRSDIAARDIERGNARAHAYDATEPNKCIDFTSPEELDDCKREQAASQHQKEHTEADLHAQSDMAAFARGLLWFTAFGFVASAGGLVALVWTFREQRKLTINQSRAVLQVKGISVAGSNYGTFWLYFVLHNHGETAAFDVYAKGELHFSPACGESGEPLDKEARESFVTHTIEQIPPEADGKTRCLCEEAEALLRLPADAGRNPYIGAEGSAPAELFIKGEIIYTDIFEHTRRLPFHMKMLELGEGATDFGSLTKGYVGG